VARIGEARNAYRILVGKSVGKESLAGLKGDGRITLR
jgi:hypothetical protein